MTLQEFALRILAAIRPLIPYLVAAAAATLGALVILLAFSRDIWTRKGRFSWLSLFFDLGRGDTLRLSCVWLKLVLAVLYLLAFQKLTNVHYLLFLMPGLVWCLDPKALLRLPGRLMWLVLELAGLLSANLICGYIRDVDGSPWYWAAYVLLSIFVIQFALYLFLTEAQEVSSERRASLELDTGKN